jgi:predicted O-methyltransferase YrrM
MGAEKNYLMYSRLQIVRKYIHYYLTASNGKGHGVHSPFVYDFIRNVLNDQRVYDAYAPIGMLRSRLLKDKTLLEVEDMGAGSAHAEGRRRTVGEIARHAAKPEKLGRLLYRIAGYYRSQAIVELGTSLGLSTAYLASGAASYKLQAESGEMQASSGELRAAGDELRVAGEGKDADRRVRAWTIEGAGAVAAVAAKNFRELGLEEIRLIVGNFDERLEGVLEQAGTIDLAFVDGNHRLEPTLRYFHLLMSRCAPSSILIFDDIHWSAEMEAAWARIQGDPRVYMTIDLFFIGLVVLRDEFKVKQHFVIRV